MKTVILNSQYKAARHTRAPGYAVASTHTERDGTMDWLADEADGLMAYLDDYDQVITWGGIERDLPTLWETLGCPKISCRLVNDELVRDTTSGMQLDAPQFHLFGRVVDLCADLRDAGYDFPQLHVVAEASLGIALTATPYQMADFWLRQKRFELLQACRHSLLATRRIYEYGRDKGYVRYYNHRGAPCKTDPIRWTLRDPWGRALPRLDKCA